VCRFRGIKPKLGGENWSSCRNGVFTVGLLATIGLEYFNTEVTGRWAYDGVMLLLPALGTGLSPILQWVFVPLLVLWYMRRLASKNVDQRHNLG